MGKFNGFGGKVRKGDAIIDAARREMKEECGLDIPDPKKVGFLRFYLPERTPAREIETHVFFIDRYLGDLEESDEMLPQWFRIADIPYDEMWPDDRHWFPLFLKGKKFRGTFSLGKDDVILEQELEEVTEID